MVHSNAETLGIIQQDLKGLREDTQLAVNAAAEAEVELARREKQVKIAAELAKGAVLEVVEMEKAVRLRSGRYCRIPTTE